jgi:hypothetical protein
VFDVTDWMFYLQYIYMTPVEDLPTLCMQTILGTYIKKFLSQFRITETLQAVRWVETTT